MSVTFIDMTGVEINGLRVLGLAPKVGEKTRWRVLCPCGREFVAQGGSLRHGRTHSCGCFQRRQLEANAVERFWSFVAKGDGCWTWRNSLAAGGYGQFRIKGKRLRAHRVAWVFTHGPIPDGLLVCHKCDNPACVRPDHLFLGTYEDNGRDMVAKGRQAQQRRPWLTLRGDACPWAKLNSEQVQAIRESSAAGERHSILAKRYDVSQATITDIVKGRRWRSLASLQPAGDGGEPPKEKR